MSRNRLPIALATLPAERYVGLLAGPDRATIATRPITRCGRRSWTRPAAPSRASRSSGRSG
ncbi:MAG: hypothetical protein DMG07_09490 [Acidobacteria bacterium]|nr:MAG: hypothetical protein DMG07_09490 [Acidobacteriota bacterium]